MPSSIAFFAKVTSSCCIFLARLVFLFRKQKKKKRLPKARNGLHLLRKERSKKLLLITYREKKRGITKEK